MAFWPLILSSDLKHNSNKETAMNKQLSLPSEQEEIHIVTAAGKTVFICESVERALIYWEEMLPRPVDWRVVKVTVMKDDITPRQMLPAKPRLVVAA